MIFLQKFPLSNVSICHFTRIFLFNDEILFLSMSTKNNDFVISFCVDLSIVGISDLPSTNERRKRRKRREDNKRFSENFNQKKE